MSRFHKGLLFVLIPTAVNLLILEHLPDAGEAFGVSPETKAFILQTVIYSFFPIGVYYIATRNRVLSRLRSRKHYEGLNDEQLIYLDNFSWGAFLGSFIWAFANRLNRYGWQCFIPIWGIYIVYKLGIDGRKLAWEKYTPKQFNRFKRKEELLEIAITITLPLLGALAYLSS